MAKEVSAGAVLFRREKGKIYYLLLHYPAGHWDFPKGHIERGEKPEETIKREIKEETGISEIRLLSGFEEKIHYFYVKDKKRIAKTVIFCLAETDTKEVKISFEHQGFLWLPYEEALEKITFNNAKEVLKKAHQWLLKNLERQRLFLLLF